MSIPAAGKNIKNRKNKQKSKELKWVVKNFTD